MITRIPVERLAQRLLVRWEPRLDDEHDAYAWCTFTEAERRLSWPGDPGTLDHLRATLAVLRRAHGQLRTAVIAAAFSPRRLPLDAPPSRVNYG